MERFGTGGNVFEIHFCRRDADPERSMQSNANECKVFAFNRRPPRRKNRRLCTLRRFDPDPTLHGFHQPTPLPRNKRISRVGHPP
jgi:hypothetical protein